jgi:predicted S18 family serine protease
MKEQYSKGIRAGIKAVENAKSDYKATIDRVAEACRWKTETTNSWIDKGELAYGNLLERAEAALKEAEEKEEAEAKSGSWRLSARSWWDWRYRPGIKCRPRPKSRCWRSWRKKWTTGRRWWETWVGP